LKKLVEKKGGFENVCKGKRWAEIGRDLGYSGKIMSSLSTSLKNSYQKWLAPYEDWLKQNKPSVMLQNEREQGGPFTPSPANTPMKPIQSSPAPAPHMSHTPVKSASAALNASINDKNPPQPVFTPVNGGGFTAVNAPTPTFTPVNQPYAPPAIVPTPPVVKIEGPRMHPGGIDIMNPSFDQPNPLKRQLSTDDNMEEDVFDDGRRSKRFKKDNAPTVTGSYMIQPRIPGPTPMTLVVRDKSKDQPGDCDVCGKGTEAGPTKVCDTCDCSYHTTCLEAPLKSQSDQDWHCPRCLVGTGEFGFEEGGIYSLRQFQEKADHFKKRYFASKIKSDDPNIKVEITDNTVEEEFWRLTEALTETVEVEYGADIHSTTHGSGFPTMEREPNSEYSIDPWNLNVMPLEKESLFRHIKTDISGMTVPWLYVGMCFSTFCWHNEDHYTYSANYQHFGDVKTWYGIPSGSADKFEKTIQEVVPELFEQQPDLLFQLTTLLQPEKLLKAGVDVYALDQRAGEFVITFPQAYHAGFNHGFNFNEAVNFAPSDWEPYGSEAIDRLQQFRRQPVFSHDELLFSAVERDHSIKTAKWLAPALTKVINREKEQRANFTAEYKRSVLLLPYRTSVHITDEPTFVKDAKEYADEETVCIYCRAYCFPSRFLCKKTGRVVCLAHAATVSCCEAVSYDRLSLADGNHELQYRFTDDELSTILSKVQETASTPEVWYEKYHSLLDETKPSLRSLRTLLSEGEKIDSTWPLPELADLQLYVKQCNAWVDEATIYIARKPNRRKSESRFKMEDPKKKAVEDGKKNPRDPENVARLIQEADDISFDCPELDRMIARKESIEDFRQRARAAISAPHSSSDELDALIEEAQELDMDFTELVDLNRKAATVHWFAEASKQMARTTSGSAEQLSLDEVKEMVQAGRNLNITEDHQFLRYFQDQIKGGEFWESKAHQVMSVENINFQQLDALFAQAKQLPVSRETLVKIEELLKKQREAEERVVALFEKSKDIDFRKRPMYNEVRETMLQLGEMNIKPPGTLDLEKEQKRHEDWMRKGKKLFGKANAPLHILLQHMTYVCERNEHCLDLADQPRMPAEPASREPTPVPNSYADGSTSSSNVFCVCRKSESGMMIECELCHEW
jgi:histone demethylase JARID1